MDGSPEYSEMSNHVLLQPLTFAGACATNFLKDRKRDGTWEQSHKNPVSASAMLTGKFLQIRKVFATSSLLAEEFPGTLQYKISR